MHFQHLLPLSPAATSTRSVLHQQGGGGDIMIDQQGAASQHTRVENDVMIRGELMGFKETMRLAGNRQTVGSAEEQQIRLRPPLVARLVPSVSIVAGRTGYVSPCRTKRAG